ncbi:MAG: Vitamin B12 transporter BtuB [Pseudomonadales bacterium]|nr:Vitamin B12 transporter BtuB [Pseudomonadales bacterium]
MSDNRNTIRTLCLAIGAIAAGQLQAQTALDEMIVTAQKREENLQAVPLAISAVSGEDLELRNIEGLGDLNAIAPNVMFRQNPGARLISTVSIRGSATGQPAIWLDPPVGMYLNGIYLGKAQGSVFDVVDIERVEVLRGPQGTLFGRNTEGGAINFVARRPSGEFSGSAKVELGNYDRRIGRVQMDLPQMGMASVSLAARKEVADGWAHNRTGPDMGEVDSEAFRGSAKFDVSDRFVAVYDLDYSNIDQTPAPSSLTSLTGWGGTFPSVFGSFLGSKIQEAATPYVTTSRPSTVSTNMTPGQKGPMEASEGLSHALTLEYDLTEDDTIKYIGAYRSMDFEDSQDIDGMPLVSVDVVPGFSWGMAANYNRATEYEQLSHELQWIASRDTVNWVAGLYWFEDEGTTRGSQQFTLFGAAPQQSNYAADTEAWAAFGQLDWQFAEDWTATVGMRYTEEERSGWTHRYLTNGFGGSFVTDVGAGLLPYTSYSEAFDDTTPMAALSWAVNDDVNVYARVAKGFKSGGFSSEVADPAVATPFEPQSSLSKEIGVKSLWWDGRARLNVALFHNEVTDLQITQLLPGTTQSLLTNAGEAVYKGAEVEFALQITDDWLVSGNWGYLDTSFDKYLDNSFAPGRPIIDTASNRLAPYAPENTFSLQLQGTLARLSFGELMLLLDYSFTDDMYLYAVNKDLAAPNAGGSYVKSLDGLPDTQNLNVRVQLSDVPVGDGAMDFAFFVRNATDEDKLVQGIDFSMFRNGSWQEPRTYMFSAAYKW